MGDFLYKGVVALVSLWNVSYCDAPVPWQIGFQDPATPIALGIQDLHHDIFFFLVVVLTFVVWMLGRTLYHFSYDATTNSEPTMIIHGTVIEVVWTVMPALTLLVIAIPSFSLLYSMDDLLDPDVTLKCIGHQWYWSYEYSDYADESADSLAFDSYMIPEDDLEPGQLRLLEVDNRIVLPVEKHVRLIITSADVLHSWTIPSLGVKCDAVPGRLNQTSFFAHRQGIFYGQCSEICGTNHGFMPIVVEIVDVDSYLDWVVEAQANM
jgi:cytochrome c oxidase subunit 2